jgi:Fur family transcriptional regulator, peroxide stress response regulator
MTNFLTMLKVKSLTVTPQRLEILNLLSSNKHVNVDQLYALLQKSFPSISLATVYKNINVMLENSLLSEVQIPSKKSVYEINESEHSHVLCTSCNEILDLDLELSELFKNAEELSQYILHNASVVLSGVCPACHKK